LQRFLAGYLEKQRQLESHECLWSARPKRFAIEREWLKSNATHSVNRGGRMGMQSHADRRKEMTMIEGVQVMSVPASD
jgi:hypothetical protein